MSPEQPQRLLLDLLARPQAATSLTPNGSPRMTAAAATPTTGVSIVVMAAVDGGNRRSAANQVR